jgi:hypothetical protein
MNSWFSNFLIEELRTDYLPQSKIKYSFMGTKDDSDRPIPYLFEPKFTSITISYSYNQEIFDNDIIIYNLNDSNLDEVEYVIRGLKALKYKTEKILILVSNIMTWANTPLKNYTEEELKKYNLENEEEIPSNFNEQIKMNISYDKDENNSNENLYSENGDNDNEIKDIPILDTKRKINEEIHEIKEEEEELNELDQNNENQNNDNENNNNELNDKNIEVNNVEKQKKSIKKVYYFKEEDYPKRIPDSRYFYFKKLETQALQIKNQNLKEYVVCPGFVYGCGEDFFF